MSLTFLKLAFILVSHWGTEYAKDSDLQHSPLKELTVFPKMPTMISSVTGKTWLIITYKQLTVWKGHAAHDGVFK